MTRTEVKNHEHQNTKKSVAEESDAEMLEFSCDMCDKEFSQMPLLEAHIMDEHLRNQIKSKIDSEVEPDQEVDNDIKQESEPKSIRPKVVLKKQSESKITYYIIFGNNK